MGYIAKEINRVIGVYHLKSHILSGKYTDDFRERIVKRYCDTNTTFICQSLPSIRERVNKLCCCIFANPEKRFVALHIQLHIPTESIGQAYGLKTGGFLNVCVGKLLP